VTCGAAPGRWREAERYRGERQPRSRPKALANGLPLPKAGIIAELEGARVAAAIAAEVQGGELPPPFDGHGHCFIEMGRSTATLVEGDFFAEPEPVVQLREPSADNAEEKRRFEAERLVRWFGR
jgi:sulfide:quinone oxidoreductase